MRNSGQSGVTHTVSTLMADSAGGTAPPHVAAATSPGRWRRAAEAAGLIALLAALVVTGCGGGSAPETPDAGTSGLLIGEGCPDSCIPRCVFAALSTIGNAMPAGNSKLYSAYRCYENGIVEFGGCSGTGQQRDFYKNGTILVRWSANFTEPETSCYGGPKNPGSRPTFLEVKGPSNELLVEARATNMPPTTWTFICEGGTRMVDLTVNATNPECRSCPADFVRLPIPPLPVPTFGDESCHP